MSNTSLSQNPSLKQTLEVKKINSLIQKQNESLSQRSLEITKENKKLRLLTQKLQRERETLQKTLERCQEENTAFQQKEKERDEYVRKLKAKVTAFRGMPLKKVLKLKDKAQEQEKIISQLQHTINTQSEQIQVLNDALELQAQENGAPQADLLYDVAHLRRDNTQLSQKLHFVQQQLDSLSSQNQEIHLTREGIMKENGNLAEELDDVKQSLSEARDEVQELQAENDSLKADNDTLVQTLEEKMAEFNELQDKYDKLEQDYHDLKEETDTTIQNQDSELTQIREELQTLRQEYDDLSNAANMDSVKLTSLYQKSDDMEAQIAELQLQLNEANEQHAATQEQLDNFASMNADLDALAKSEKEQREAAEKALQMSKEKIEQLREEVDDISHSKSNAVEMLRNKLKDKLEEEAALMEDRDKWRRFYEALVEEKQSLEARLRETDKNEQELHQKIEKMHQTKTMMQQTLLQQIKTLKNELKQYEEKEASIMHAQEKKTEELNKLKILLNARVKSTQNRLGSGSKGGLNSSGLSTSGTNILEASKEFLRSHRQHSGDTRGATILHQPLSPKQFSTKITQDNHSSFSNSHSEKKRLFGSTPQRNQAQEVSYFDDNSQSNSEHSSSYSSDEDVLNSSGLILGAQNVLLQPSPARLSRFSSKGDRGDLTLQEMLNG